MVKYRRRKPLTMQQKFARAEQAASPAVPRLRSIAPFASRQRRRIRALYAVRASECSSMRLEDWSNDAIAYELRKQRDALKLAKEGSQPWLAATRIIHHVSSEQQRRRNAARTDGVLSGAPGDCVGEEWLARSQRG